MVLPPIRYPVNDAGAEEQIVIERMLCVLLIKAQVQEEWTPTVNCRDQLLLFSNEFQILFRAL